MSTAFLRYFVFLISASCLFVTPNAHTQVSAGAPAALGAREIPVPRTGDGNQGDNFSWASAQCGNDLLVSAITDIYPAAAQVNGSQTGSIYQYANISGRAQLVAKIAPTIDDDGARFGAAIACDAQTLVVGAPGTPSAIGLEAGTVHIYAKNGNQWQLQSELAEGLGAGESYFGVNLALTATHLVVGTGGENAVYVYQRAGSSFSLVRRLSIAPADPSDRFGQRIAVDQNTLLVTLTGQQTSQVYAFSLRDFSVQAQFRGGNSFGAALAINPTHYFIAEPSFVPTGSKHATGRVRVIPRNGGPEVGVLPPATASTSPEFGRSIVLSGNRLYVGAPGAEQFGRQAEGAAYAYTLAGDQAALLLSYAPDTANNQSRADLFGSYLSLFNDDLLVSASNADAAGHPGQGKLYRFDSRGNKVADYDNGRGAGFDRFAQAVATDRSRAIVGAYLGDSLAGIETGYADVLVRTRTGWQHEARLSPPDFDIEEEQRFGIAVDIDGNWAVVGSFWDIVDGAVDAGSAYVFERTNAGWQFRQKLTAATPRNRAYFGFALAMSGNTIAIGARGDAFTAGDQGSVTFFQRDANGTYDAGTLVQLEDARSFDFFGASVDLQGSTAIIGAPGVTRDGVVATGRAYLYQASPTGNVWRLVQTVVDTNGEANDGLGYSVALSANQQMAVVGSPFAPANGTASVGKALTVKRSNGQWQVDRVLLPPANSADSKIGNQFAVAVGINDQFAVIGASGFDANSNTIRDAGRAYQYGFDGVLRQIVEPPPTIRASFGRAISADAQRVMVAAPGTARADVQEGTAYEFLADQLFGDSFD